MTDQTPTPTPLSEAEEAYLWDPTHTPAPAIAEIERRLAPLALSPASLPVPARRSWRPLLLAAAIVLAVSATWYFLTLGSAPRLGEWAIASHSGPYTLSQSKNAKSPGAMLTLSPGAKLTLANEAGQRVFLDEGAEVELGGDANSLTLLAGGLFAETSAGGPPFTVRTGGPRGFTFSPDTAASVIIAPDGAWRVALKRGVAEYSDGKLPPYRFPAEAICRMDPTSGVLAPYFHDAPKGLIEGLTSLRAAWTKQPGAPSIDMGIDLVLKAARPRDAMTLWNLLPRVGDSARGRIAARLTQLAPEATEAAGPGLARAAREALDAWWRAAFP